MEASDRAALARCATLALEGIQRPYPYHLAHVMNDAGDLATPSELTPVFAGCFDWHSAVHGHWLLATCLRLCPDDPIAARCRTMLGEQLRADPLLVETAHLRTRPGFERPYGLAWVLALAAELERHDKGDEAVRAWREAIRPLEAVSWENLRTWLGKLTDPMRTGTHNQTAFALALVHDWAVTVGERSAEACVRERAESDFGADHDYALHLEPGGEDFLSPSLGSAWLMALLRDRDAFTTWFERTLPELGAAIELTPAVVADRSDGRLAHLDGLNLSRAWMLHAIAARLGDTDHRFMAIERMATAHRVSGLASIETTEYAGTHWLGTFAAWMLLHWDRPV